MKARKQENVRFMVKWIEGRTMYFRAYKRDRAACSFMDYLTDVVGIRPEDVQIVMM